jgi:hypothetical protein
LAAAIMQNFGTFAVMANAGRLLKFQDRNPEQERMEFEAAETTA